MHDFRCCSFREALCDSPGLSDRFEKKTQALEDRARKSKPDLVGKAKHCCGIAIGYVA